MENEKTYYLFEEGTMMTIIQQAKRTLKENGYYTDNLWCVNDVMDKYDCDKDQAMKVLHSAMTNSATMEQINLAIEVAAEDDVLRELEDFEGFRISGYWKEDRSEFEGYLVSEYDDVIEDLDKKIFYYGLGEKDIIDAMENPDDNRLDFVITSYQKENFKY